MENIKMATKLGKEIGVCECCGEKMVKNMYNQKYHSACKDQVDVDRIINLYHKTKKKFNKIKSKIVMLRNGLEINTNTIIGKEIANKW